MTLLGFLSLKTSFSSKSSVLKYLKEFEIPIRETGIKTSKKNYIAYGRKMEKRREVDFKKEVENINRMRELRDKGYTYEKIAEVFNTLKIPTKTHRGKWNRKTIQAILNRH